MEKVVIFGASGHAKVVIDIFERQGSYEIIGLLDSNKDQGVEIFGCKVLGDMDQIPLLLKETPELCFFIAIGDNWTRSLIVKQLLEIAPNIRFVNAIHPNSIMGKNVVLGKGIMIMAGSIINADSYIGDFTIINTKSSVGHESILGDFCSLAPNSTLAGNVRVGEFSAVSLSATVLNGRVIGNHCVIGSGSLLIKDVDDFSVYYGVPARFIRFREKGERYL